MKLLLSDVLSEDAMKSLDKYVESISEASQRFASAVKLLNDINIEHARTYFTEVIKTLNESNKYKSIVEEEIANTRLDPGFKEEILGLISLLDDLGDSIKEAAREFTILPFLEIPVNLRSGLLALSRLVSEMIEQLDELIKALINGKYDIIDEIINKLIEMEEKADEVEMNNRSLLLTLSDKLKPYALQLLIHDLNALLENTADLCLRIARGVKLTVIAWLT